MKGYAWRARLVPALLAWMAASGAVQAQVGDINQQGLSGGWFNPALPGQGLLLEVYPSSNQLFGTWFTFDTVAGDVTRQRWYSIAGSTRPGASSAAVTIYRNSGGNFAAGPPTHAEAVGTGVLNFGSCTEGSFGYSFSDGRSNSMPLARLLDASACASAPGMPSPPAQFGLSGSWYAPATSGQGFLIEINPGQAYAFLGWFTYAPDGAGSGVSGQRWFTAQGDYAPGSTRIAMTLNQTTGGTFDSAASSAMTVPVGTLTLDYASCSAASASYAFASGELAGRSGTIALSRVGPVPAGCRLSGNPPVAE